MIARSPAGTFAASTIAVAGSLVSQRAPVRREGRGSWRADELVERLRDTRLAYVLEPGFAAALRLARALGEAGRADDVRTLVAAPLGNAESQRVLTEAAMAFVDLHDAKIRSAIERLEAAGNVAMIGRPSRGRRRCGSTRPGGLEPLGNARNSSRFPTPTWT